jgi:DNA invertase Pin-like site-specific DNA recombinase
LTGLAVPSGTSTSGDKLVFHFFGALAEFERDLKWGADSGGPDSGQARGRLGGGPRVAPQKVKLAKALNADKRHSVEEICHTLGMSRTTFYRYMKK